MTADLNSKKKKKPETQDEKIKWTKFAKKKQPKTIRVKTQDTEDCGVLKTLGFDKKKIAAEKLTLLAGNNKLGCTSLGKKVI